MKYIQPKSPYLKGIEIVVLAMIWLGVFSIPFFQNRQYGLVDWSKVFVEWIRMFTFLIIFMINAYYFVPKLLFQKKYLPYIGFTLSAIFAFIGIGIIIQSLIIPSEPLQMPPMELGPGMPPMELGSKMPAPLGFRTPHIQEQKSLLMTFTDNLIISILVAGAGTTLKMMSKWLNEENRRMDVEKEQLKTELALLRHQVSPHFFMNTLNNIHAMIDINVETAKDAIIRLSTLMRYLLYDTAQGQTSLKKEVEFIESYISLMQLRFSKKVVISVNLPERIPEIQIPPMLFISFLENAFKHGVSYQAESFVSFNLELIDNQLNCTIRNSKHSSKEIQDKSYSGIGLTNIRKSLDLLFKNEYTLKIHENDKEFEVQFIIPVYENKMLSR